MRRIILHLLVLVSLICITAFEFNVADQVEQDKTIQFADSLFIQGKYSEALDKYLFISKELGRNFGESSLNYAESLLKIAECKLYLGFYDEVLLICKNITEVCESHVCGRFTLLYSGALLNMSAAYRKTGKLVDAELCVNEAAGIREVLVGTKHQDYLPVIENKGQLYIALGKYKEAVLFLSEAEKYFPNSVMLHNTLASGFKNLGRYDECLPHYFRALDLQKTISGERHPLYAELLANVGAYYGSIQNFSESLRYLCDAENIMFSLFGEQHPDYALILANISEVALLTGQTETSEQFARRALNIVEASLGTRCLGVVLPCQVLMRTLTSTGRYDEAIVFGQKVIDWMERSRLDNTNPYIAFTGDFSRILSVIGRQDMAMDYLQRVISMCDSDRSNTTLYSDLIVDMSVMCWNSGRRAKAIEYAEYAKTLIENNIEYQSSVYPHVLVVLGKFYYAIGNFQRAVSMLSVVIDNFQTDKDNNIIQVSYLISALLTMSDIYRDLEEFDLSSDYLSLAFELVSQYNAADAMHLNVLFARANLSCRKEEYKEALTLYKQLIERIDETVGTKSYIYGQVTKAIAQCCQKLGKEKEANYYFREYCDSFAALYNLNSPVYASEVLSLVQTRAVSITAPKYRDLVNVCVSDIQNIFCYLTENEREVYINSNYSDVLEQFHYIGMRDESIRSNPIGAGAIFDVALYFKGLLLHSSEEFSSTIETVSDSLLIEKWERLRNLKYYIHKLNNEEVSKRPNNYSEVIYLADSLESEVLSQVRNSVRFMDDLSITWRDIESRLSDNECAVEFISHNLSSEKNYAAVVIRRGWTSPVVIEPFSLPSDTLTYRQIWYALEPYFAEGDVVYFSPSGMLNNKGIEYLKDARGIRMCDKYQMCRLSSTREIIKEYEVSNSSNAVLYGGINYSTGVEKMQYESDSIYGGKRSRSVSLFSEVSTAENNPWERLNWTFDEVASVRSFLESAGYETVLYSGDNAVEETFKALNSQDNSLIHIATHAFYMGGESKYDESALERSGLVFSGANNSWLGCHLPEGVDDGILTSKEISMLDLRKTELVVLSACQTGLGDLSHEGVRGLQRAFKKAGVRTLLVSLWNVDDAATQALMTEFYKELTRGLSKRDAFYNAQVAMKNYVFMKDGKLISGADPYFSNAFIMID